MRARTDFSMIMGLFSLLFSGLGPCSLDPIISHRLADKAPDK